MKSLYLNSQHIYRVERDHSALKLLSHQQTPRWMPLNRISHLHVFGDIDWQGAALNACITHNISINLYHEQGLLGHFVRHQTPQSHLQSQLSALVQLHPQAVNAWADAQQYHQQKRLLKHLALPKRHYKISTLKQHLLYQIAIRHHYYQWQTDLPHLQNMLTAQLYHILTHYGFEPLDSPLVKPLSDLISWDYWQLALKGELPKRSTPKQRVYYFEKHQAQTERHCRTYLKQLWHHLGEIHES